MKNKQSADHEAIAQLQESILGVSSSGRGKETAQNGQLPGLDANEDERHGAPWYHKLNFPIYNDEDPLPWLNRCE